MVFLKYFRDNSGNRDTQKFQNDHFLKFTFEEVLQSQKLQPRRNDRSGILRFLLFKIATTADINTYIIYIRCLLRFLNKEHFQSCPIVVYLKFLDIQETTAITTKYPSLHNYHENTFPGSKLWGLSTFTTRTEWLNIETKRNADE